MRGAWRALVVLRALVALALLALLVGGTSACDDPMMFGRLEPVPPVHRLPAAFEGVTILIAEDPIIETNEPIHIERAKKRRVPQELRASMERALGLAGFRVTNDPASPHDLVAKLALAVSEADGKVRQVYRCGLRGPDAEGKGGDPIAQIDWAWPDKTRVDVYDVYDFATHHLTTEIVTSRTVLAWLRARK